MEFKICFIGFGEAAYHIARGLKGEGCGPMAAFDVMWQDERMGPVIRKRAEETGVTLLAASDDCIGRADFVCSLTSAAVAVRVASGIVPKLALGQTYVDMNSAGPSVKEAIAKLPHAEGVAICDAAVMGTVPGNGHRVPMFLAGDGAQGFYDAMSPFNMKLTVLRNGENVSPAGSASAIKMLKSVVMKGLPQLMLESFIAAERYGVLDTLVKSLSGSLNGKTVEQLADTFVARTAIHAARRAAEMRDVRQMLGDLHCDSSMTDATIARLDKLAADGWGEKFGPEGGSMDFRTAIRKLAE